MSAILGIDAAWTAGEPSGVALIRTTQEGSWECVELASSYDAFIESAGGYAVRWDERPKGGSLEPDRLLRAAKQLLKGERVTAVSIDMPLSLEPITGRRTADDAISKAFGAKGCSTHTPSSTRPGAISDGLRKSLAGLGYRLAVSKPGAATVIEVYPHPALLCLLDRDYRVPYKVGKSRIYWPGLTVNQRTDKLITKFRSIYDGLTDVVREVPDFLPSEPYGKSLSSLKPYEDGLDALVCAWVGARYFEGCATPYGDDVAAIWIPNRKN